MTKKHSRLFDKSTAEPERIERVVEGYEAVLSRIEALRATSSHRTLGEMDGEVGREAGYLNTILMFREVLPLDRLLMLADTLGCDISDFFVTLDVVSEPIPAVGFLPARSQRRSNETQQPRILRDLRRWTKRLVVRAESSPNAFPISGGEALIEVARTNTKAALRMAEGLLGALIEADPEVVSEKSCNQLARLLTIYGDLLRRGGEHASAAEALDLAFRLDASTSDLKTRAFTYRMGTYLLNDLGHLDDGLMFVQRSERLCVRVGDAEGLGWSLYIQAICLALRGSFRMSAARFEACRSMLASRTRDPMFEASIEHSIAWVWVLAGQLDSAQESAQRLHATLKAADMPPSTVFFGYHQVLRAEIASMSGAGEAVGAQYQAAAEILRDQAGHVLDRLLVGMLHVRHLLRYSQVPEAQATFRELVPLAAEVAGNVWAEAFVLDLLRGQAALTLDSLERAIRSLQHARLQR